MKVHLIIFGAVGAVLILDAALIGILVNVLVAPLILMVAPLFVGYLSKALGTPAGANPDVRQGTVEGGWASILAFAAAVVLLSLLNLADQIKLPLEWDLLPVLGLGLCAVVGVGTGALGGSMAARNPVWSSKIARFVRQNALQLGIIGVFIVLWNMSVVGSPLTFLNKGIYQSFMTSIPFWGVIALPLTMVVIAGEIDLSFISIMAVGMVAFWQVYDWTGSLGVALAGCLAAGFLVGLSNGIIVVYLGIPSLVATIGTQYFWRGVVEVIRQGQGQSLVVTQGSILRDSLVGKALDYFPLQAIWMVLIAVAMWIILNRHKFGAHTYLIGDNENSARLMGVNANRTRLLLFALVGLAAALGGLMQSVQVRYFWINLGEGYLMNTLGAVFLGGTSVFGGTGTILGTFVGSFIIGIIQPAIIAAGLTDYWTKLIYGLIITASVAMHALLRRRME
jgi:simple sugar transport system permease protein